MEHFNAFCVAFGEAKKLYHPSKKNEPVLLTEIEKMVSHYDSLDQRMQNYIMRWNQELVQMGFWVKYHNPWVGRELPRIDVGELVEKETSAEITGTEDFQVSGEEKHVKIREDIAHRDGQKVLVGNYCEYSTPWSNMDKSEKEVIMQKTKENIRNSSLGITDPKAASKRIKKYNMRKQVWTLPDSQRDW